MPSPLGRLKRVLFGRPLASDRLEHERLNKRTALAVLSSDAISSVAYATEQTLIVLAVLGAAALNYVVPISAVIVGLLVLVALSYRQTIFAYPGGGGSYTVAKDNLGTMPGLIAAAALLTDYILTVSVSISGGVAAITSAYPQPAAAHGAGRSGGRVGADARQPARRARVGNRLQHSDVCVRRDDGRHDRGGDHHGVRRDLAARRDCSARSPARDARRRSASRWRFSCCADSPKDVRR